MKRSAPPTGDYGGNDLHKLTFKPLGSGQEVGRSCHILEFMGKRIMFDCGIHPGRQSEDALPFFDEIEGDIDLCLITHFHLDHIASLPYLTEKTNIVVKQIYMTPPTRSVAHMLLSDYVRVGGSTDQGVLYDEKDVSNCLNKCRKIDFHQEIEVGGINITCYNAGHVLGACMFLVEISGIRILYTGDYSREDDRHLMGAEIPRVSPDILIVESTFGEQQHESRMVREERFTTAVHSVVKRGGRAQELCLILEEYWAEHPELQSIPIYHVSRLAAKSLNVYRSFSSFMNSNIQNSIPSKWFFQHISSFNNTKFDEFGPAVVLASPGMLQSGASRQLFEQWCSEKRNGVILAGYCVEGTLARDLMSASKTEFPSIRDGRILPINCEVKSISFAAHSDYIGTVTFIGDVCPKHVILVHGEKQQMFRLRKALEKRFSKEEMLKDMDFFTPANYNSEFKNDVSFQIAQERVVRVIGQLAQEGTFPVGTPVQGILVRRNFGEQFLHPKDVPQFTQLTSTTVKQRLNVAFHSKFERLKECVGQVFEQEGLSHTMDQDDEIGLSADDRKNARRIVVHDRITLTHLSNRVLMEWSATPTNDMLADALISVMMQADGGIPAVRDSQCCSLHAMVEHTLCGEEQEVGAIMEQVVVVETDDLHSTDIGTVKQENTFTTSIKEEDITNEKDDNVSTSGTTTNIQHQTSIVQVMKREENASEKYAEEEEESTIIIVNSTGGVEDDDVLGEEEDEEEEISNETRIPGMMVQPIEQENGEEMEVIQEREEAEKELLDMDTENGMQEKSTKANVEIKTFTSASSLVDSAKMKIDPILKNEQYVLPIPPLKNSSSVVDTASSSTIAEMGKKTNIPEEQKELLEFGQKEEETFSFKNSFQAPVVALLIKALEDRFGENACSVNLKKKGGIIHVNNTLSCGAPSKATVHMPTLKIESPNKTLENEITNMLQWCERALLPLGPLPAR